MQYIHKKNVRWKQVTPKKKQLKRRQWIVQLLPYIMQINMQSKKVTLKKKKQVIQQQRIVQIMVSLPCMQQND